MTPESIADVIIAAILMGLALVIVWSDGYAAGKRESEK